MLVSRARNGKADRIECRYSLAHQLSGPARQLSSRKRADRCPTAGSVRHVTGRSTSHATLHDERTSHAELPEAIVLNALAPHTDWNRDCSSHGDCDVRSRSDSRQRSRTDSAFQTGHNESRCCQFQRGLDKEHSLVEVVIRLEEHLIEEFVKSICDEIIARVLVGLEPDTSSDRSW
jgi:hypothetical protein